MMKTMMDNMEQINSYLQALEMKVQHLAGNAGIEEEMSGERSEPAAEDGVTRITPHDGTRTVI